MESSEKKWIPLEGNPIVFNDFAERLGFPAVLYKFHDVFSLDDDMWSFLPQPILAVILLYTIKD